MAVRGHFLLPLAGWHGIGCGLPLPSQSAQGKGSSNVDVGEQINIIQDPLDDGLKGSWTSATILTLF